ncbi:hypothetical protein GCM10009868_37060 [Terrabacter aerolatus]|uniref:Uncharacterized protein n=1 Tax=Terrabacter aerolatus TaxID=422442 RepID=A0A512CVQ9_9MICO|nr:hypothetical protein [Terrabacter aerolatus]GEO28311.1 hypothetical protein TAE01_01210 [Terrabacter aerolatus]
MSVQQYLLEGRSLDELAREATALYGAGARIVRAERVLDPGVAGFLGRRHLEVMVEVPDTYVPVTTRRPGVHVLGDRTGLLALLDSADRAEDDVNATSAEPGAIPSAPIGAVATVSTESDSLSELLSRLGVDRGDHDDPARTAHASGAAVPALLDAPGDLVLVLGLGDSAWPVTDSMAAALERSGRSIARHGGGAAARPGGPRLASRWDAAEARALAVEAHATVVTAYGLGSPTTGLPHLDEVGVLGPDQVWLVVDARHKADETFDWVATVREVLHVDALAVVGAGDSRTAHTVNGLGLPLGWLDGMPAPRTVL